MRIKAPLLFIFCIAQLYTQAQNDLKFSLNDDGTNYVKFTGLGQMWVRSTQLNDGSLINGEEMDSYSDISVRRLRFQVIGQLSDRVFFYTQFGQNNFNFHSEKFQGSFFHDAVLEYAVAKKKFSIGTGLTGWSGLARYASPSIGSILPLDVPLFLQATNGVNDQFIRKLSVYAKGQLGKLDYRVTISQPMSISGLPQNQTAPTNQEFSFANGAAKKQVQGYFKWMFLDKESNLTPYEAGTYLGGKRVFNIGAGIIYQPDALWTLNATSETIYHDMVLYGVDIFYDAPVGENQVFTAYGVFTNYDFGSGYYRNVGVNGPANGTTGNPGGAGNGYPMIGTGNTFYAQVGYLFGDNLFTENGKIQPFLAGQLSDYDFSDDGVVMYEFGVNYLIHGSHGGKFSLGYQSRPTFKTSSGDIVIAGRKGMTVLQYQVSF